MVFICLKKDKERNLSQHLVDDVMERLNISPQFTETIIDSRITKELRYNTVREKTIEFSKSELNITDHLHRMIFSAMTGTPCIVFGNNHHKIEESYEWLKLLDYIRFVEMVDKAVDSYNYLMKNNEKPEYQFKTLNFDCLRVCVCQIARTHQQL